MSRQHQYKNNNNNKNPPLQKTFRKPSTYQITNTEDLSISEDRRTQRVVFCQNNPNHIVLASYYQTHLRECDESTWRPHQNIPKPPHF